MVVKIGILIITISLLVNEFYPFLNTFGPRLRRILILSIISLLTIFSIIDIYNDDQNTTDIKLKTEEIYKKAKETNELQDQSHSSIQESRMEIAGVDSILEIVSDTLNGQVSLLNEAVRKSKELIDLEELKLKLERPLISIISNNVRFSEFFQDSTKIGLEIKIRNIGKRKAINPSYNYILVTHKNQSNKNVFFNLYDFKKLDDFSSGVQALREKGSWDKQAILDLFFDLLPEFAHKETGKYLDQRM